MIRKLPTRGFALLLVLLLVTLLSTLMLPTSSNQLSQQRQYRQSQLVQVIEALYRYRQQHGEWPADLPTLNHWLPAPLSYPTWRWREAAILNASRSQSALHLALPPHWPDKARWTLYFESLRNQLGDWLVLPEQLPMGANNRLDQLLSRDGQQSNSMLTELDMAGRQIAASATVTATRVSTENAAADTVQVGRASTGQLSFAEPASTLAIDAQTVKVSELQAFDVSSQQATLKHAELQQINAQQATLTAITSEQVNSQTLRSARGQLLQLHANQAQLQSLTSRLPVRGRQLNTPLSTVDQNYQALADLQQHMQRCMAADGWCQAAKIPRFSWSCQGCQQEQQAPDFSAKLTVNLAACVHGCNYQLRLPTGVRANCPLSGRIAAVNAPALTAECRLSGQLALQSSIQGELQLTVSSGKKAEVKRVQRLALAWHRKIQGCPAQRVSIAIPNSDPLQVLSAQLGAGVVGELQNTGPLSYQCLPNAPGGDPIRTCSLNYRCQPSGEWLRTSSSIRCYCHFNEPHA